MKSRPITTADLEAYVAHCIYFGVPKINYYAVMLLLEWLQENDVSRPEKRRKK